MLQLHRDYPEFVKRNTAVLVVAPDTPKQLQKFWREHDLQFPGLADPGQMVLKLYGQSVELLKLGRMPALFVIDGQGVIRQAHFARSMSDIPASAELLPGC